MISRVGGGSKIRLTVPGKLTVEAGQYINLGHVDTIDQFLVLPACKVIHSSWEEGERTTLDLLGDPHKGLTSKLERLAKSWQVGPITVIAVWHCSRVRPGPALLWVSLKEFSWSLGIVAQLPYL